LLLARKLTLVSAPVQWGRMCILACVGKSSQGIPICHTVEFEYKQIPTLYNRRTELSKAYVRHAKKSSRATLSRNFVAQQSCIGNCQFSIGKQSPNKHRF